MVEQLPSNYIGEVDYIAGDNVAAALSWGSVTHQWNANTTILMPPNLKYYYNGQCEGNIRVIGVITNCSLLSRSVDLSNLANNGTTVFVVNFT